MPEMLYKAIKTEKQYYEYNRIVRDLDFQKKKSKHDRDVIDLLTALIGFYDMENNSLPELDPVQRLQSILVAHNMKPIQMAEFLGISKSLMSDILNYRRGFSKPIIRKLADRFKLRQEAFNRPYTLVNAKPASGTKRAKKAAKVRT